MQSTEILFVLGLSSLFYFCDVTQQIIEKYGNGVALFSNSQQAKKHVYHSLFQAQYQQSLENWVKHGYYIELFTVQERQPMYQRWQKSAKL